MFRHVLAPLNQLTCELVFLWPAETEQNVELDVATSNRSEQKASGSTTEKMQI